MKRLLLVPALLAAPLLQAADSPQGKTYESIAKLPDFSGLWEIQRGSTISTNTQPSLSAKYAAMAEKYRNDQQSGKIQDSPQANCVPNGMPIIMTQPYPIEFLVTPGKVTILIEAYSQWRQIFTDGRQHPEDPDPTYNGHSIGHWEEESSTGKKTLVVDSVGFTTDTAMANSFGIRHSDKMHIVERIRLAEPDVLAIETTVYDPEALTEPWTKVTAYARHPDWTLAEYVCQQNNRNFLSDDGKAGIDLDFEE